MDKIHSRLSKLAKDGFSSKLTVITGRWRRGGFGLRTLATRPMRSRDHRRECPRGPVLPGTDGTQTPWTRASPDLGKRGSLNGVGACGRLPRKSRKELGAFHVDSTFALANAKAPATPKYRASR